MKLTNNWNAGQWAGWIGIHVAAGMLGGLLMWLVLQTINLLTS